MNWRAFFTRQNLLFLVFLIFCLLEAIQMVDFSQPLLPSFQYDPANEFYVMRRDFFCAKTELLNRKVNSAAFIVNASLAQRDLWFESFYVSYILNPEILLNTDANSSYALTVVEPENVQAFLDKYPYELLQTCGNSRVLVLKRK